MMALDPEGLFTLATTTTAAAAPARPAYFHLCHIPFSRYNIQKNSCLPPHILLYLHLRNF